MITSFKINNSSNPKSEKRVSTINPSGDLEDSPFEEVNPMVREVNEKVGQIVRTPGPKSQSINKL